MPTPIADLAADPAALAAQLPGLAVASDAGEGGPDAVGRPGSVTKLLTTTAVLQLVDEGRVAFEDPVRRWIPFVDERITVFHLLTHSSGLDCGDVFIDTGDDDGCIARYIDTVVRDAPPLFPPGHTYSYNNAGMVMAGHIAALERDATFEDVLTRHVIEPAGMASASFVREDSDDPICSRGLAPAGATLQCRPIDLVRFARADLLRPDTTRLMRTRHVEAPGGVAQNTGGALGWQVWRNEHGERLQHSGGFPGQTAMLIHHVERDAVLAMIGPVVLQPAITALLDPQTPVACDEPPASLDRYVGTYRSHIMELVVRHRDDRSGLELIGPLGVPGPIEPVDRGTFTMMGQPFGFFDFDDAGAPRYMRFRARVQQRVSWD